jgi:hypothetical protein
MSQTEQEMYLSDLHSMAMFLDKATAKEVLKDLRKYYPDIYNKLETEVEIRASVPVLCQ